MNDSKNNTIVAKSSQIDLLLNKSIISSSIQQNSTEDSSVII